MHVRSCLSQVGIAAILLSFPSIAAADASIAVRLTDAEGRPVDGTVTLQRTGVTRSCRTTASRCTVTAPAGSYTVTMRPVRGSAPPPRSFTVPASGSISLALTAGPATTATSTRAVSTAQPAVRAGTTTTTTRTTSGTPVTRATRGSTSPVARATRTPSRRATRTRPSAITTRPIGVTPRAVRATPTPSTGTSSGGDGTTSGGSSGTTTRPATTTTTGVAVAQHTDTAAPSTGRNLATGRALSVQGTVLDAAGRPTDATLTVRRAGSVVGTARTTAGRFSLYDLPAATYDVTLASSRGTHGTGRFTVGSASSRVTLRVP